MDDFRDDVPYPWKRESDESILDFMDDDFYARREEED
jgi:hypothetical protein